MPLVSRLPANRKTGNQEQGAGKVNQSGGYECKSETYVAAITRRTLATEAYHQFLGLDFHQLHLRRFTAHIQTGDRDHPFVFFDRPELPAKSSNA